MARFTRRHSGVVAVPVLSRCWLDAASSSRWRSNRKAEAADMRCGVPQGKGGGRLSSPSAVIYHIISGRLSKRHGYAIVDSTVILAAAAHRRMGLLLQMRTCKPPSIHMVAWHG